MTTQGERRGLFITGTDTGVGKSIVAGGIASLLAQEGIDVGVMKPVETGCTKRGDGGLVPSDALFLRHVSRTDDPLELIVPYCFKEPLAPAVAARREGRRIGIAKLIRSFETVAGRHQFVLIEGAGGLLVPLRDDFFMMDLIKLLRLPVLIVTRATLGAINHTLLTVHAAQSARLSLAGIVINNVTGDKDTAVETNPEVIARLSRLPVWGILPYRRGLKAEPRCEGRVFRLIRDHLNVNAVYHLACSSNKNIK